MKKRTVQKIVNILFILMIPVVIMLAMRGYCTSEVKNVKRHGVFFDYLVEKNNKLDNILLNSAVVMNQDTLEVLGIKLLEGRVILENGKDYDYHDIKSMFLDKNTVKDINNLFTK